MATMTIRNIDDALKAKLRVRAALHGRSMEEEARDILRSALSTVPEKPKSLARFIRERIAPIGGVELPDVPRELARDPVQFDS